jgi:nitrite reductase (cytochrome c-552)
MRQAQQMQRRGQFLLDFIEAENSMGFHAGGEAARVLAKSIDYLRQGQIAVRDAAVAAQRDR